MPSDHGDLSTIPSYPPGRDGLPVPRRDDTPGAAARPVSAGFRKEPRRGRGAGARSRRRALASGWESRGLPGEAERREIERFGLGRRECVRNKEELA